jgi:hypothetical protein
VEKTLGKYGVPKSVADRVAHAISGASGAGGSAGTGRPSHAIQHAVQLDFAHATRVVVTGMALAMAAAFVVAVIAMPPGKAEQPVGEAEGAADEGVPETGLEPAAP